MIGDLPDLLASRAALTPGKVALEDAAREANNILQQNA